MGRSKKKTRTIVIPKGTINTNDTVVIELSPKVKSCNNLLVAKVDETTKKIYAEVFSYDDYENFGAATVLEGNHPDVATAVLHSSSQSPPPPSAPPPSPSLVPGIPSMPFTTHLYNIPTTVPPVYVPRYTMAQGFSPSFQSTSYGGYPMPNLNDMSKPSFLPTTSTFMPEQQSRWNGSGYMPSSFTRSPNEASGYPSPLPRSAEPVNLRRYFNDPMTTNHVFSPSGLDNASTTCQCGSRTNISPPFRTTIRSRNFPPTDFRYRSSYSPNLGSTARTEKYPCLCSDNLDQDVNRFLSSLNAESSQNNNNPCRCKRQDNKNWQNNSNNF